MTLNEALELLRTAPIGSEPSAVNPFLTKTQAVEVVRAAVEEKKKEGKQIIDDLFEKRVWQVVKNQKRPRY